MGDAGRPGRVKSFATGLSPEKTIVRDHPDGIARARQLGLLITPYTFRASAVTGFPDVRAEMAHYLDALGRGRRHHRQPRPDAGPVTRQIASVAACGRPTESVTPASMLDSRLPGYPARAPLCAAQPSLHERLSSPAGAWNGRH